MTEERKTIHCTGRATWLMGASLALNCFLIGVLIGPVFGDKPATQPPEMMRKAGEFDRKPPTEPAFMFARVADDLSPEEATKARAIFDEERKNFREKHKDLRDVMKQLAQIVKSENPNVDDLHKVLDQVHLSGQALHQGMGQTFERIITELSLESRQKIAAVLEAAPVKGGEDRRGRPPFGGGPHGPPPDADGGPDMRMPPPPELGMEPGQEPGQHIR